MGSDRIIRTALWATALMNVVVALVCAAPGSVLGQAAGLPAAVPAIYRLLLGWTIALFGLGYGWLARQGEIQRPLVAFGALGKLGVFAIVFLLWQGGSIPVRLLFLASGDLAFAALFVWWMRATGGSSEEGWQRAAGRGNKEDRAISTR